MTSIYNYIKYYNYTHDHAKYAFRVQAKDIQARYGAKIHLFFINIIHFTATAIIHVSKRRASRTLYVKAGTQHRFSARPRSR